MDLKGLKAAEPGLNTDGLLGASYSVEGLLNPFLFCQAYANAARQHGAVLLPHSPVCTMSVEGRRITSVHANGVDYTADTFAVTCGAWEPVVTRMAGVEVPIQHSHAEAFVTEALPPVLNNTIEVGNFYEIIHGKPKAVAIGVSQEPKGTMIVTESVTQTTELHGRVSEWGITSMAKDFINLFPGFSSVRMVRSWGRPTSFTPDEEPLIGWVPQLDNMFVATSMVETITAVPLISEWMAIMLMGKTPPLALDRFAPGRFVQNKLTGAWKKAA